MDLPRLATEYLGTLGYEVKQRRRDLLVGHKLSIAGGRETIMVWVPPREPGQSFATQEGPYLDQFEATVMQYPRAQKFMLVETYEGLSSSFRSEAKRKCEVNVRVPVLFFDAPFRIEESPEARAASSAAGELATRGTEWRRVRVSQPYSIRNGAETKTKKDILDVLLDRIRHKSATHLNLIIAPAGMGKTVLFEVLFSHLYSDFHQSKAKLRVFPRPLPMVPEYIRASVAPTLRGLIEGFLRTEFAAPIEAETFRWMLVNGFGIWLLDGLDEVIEGDTNFFDDLLDILTKPGSTAPVIVLCLRDSLLATNQDLKDFIDEFNDAVTVYELCKWEAPSKRAFARIELGDKGVDQFMAILQARKELDDLSSVPYYCKLITEEYAADRLQDSYSEPELLSRALSNILDREYSKGLLDSELLPPATVIEVLQDLAAEDSVRDFAGFNRAIIKDYTDIVLPTDLDSQVLDKLSTNMVQLALFREGIATGHVRFAQEILEHYLLGERLYRNFRTSDSAFLREISDRAIPADSVTLKTVIARLNDDDIQRLLQWLQRPDILNTAFRNILQILAFCVRDPAALRRVVPEGRSISGVKFRQLDLQGISFRRCDLTDVEFDECQLQDTKFEGAILNRTAFFLRDKADLRGATFGNMERFYSLRTRPGKPETELRVAKAWLETRTGITPAIVEPCAAANQLRYLFGKYVYPDGESKRAILDRRGILAGSAFYSPQKTLEAAISYGYLTPEVRYRDRIKRCVGDMYHEMVCYATDLILSEGLRNLLNDICPVKNCRHAPPTET